MIAADDENSEVTLSASTYDHDNRVFVSITTLDRTKDFTVKSEVAEAMGIALIKAARLERGELEWDGDMDGEIG